MAQGCSESERMLSTAIRKLNIQVCISSANLDQHLSVTMETNSTTSTECFSEGAEEFKFNHGFPSLAATYQLPLLLHPQQERIAPC